MKVRALILLAVVAVAASSLACSFGTDGIGVRGSGSVTEEERAVSGITGVDLMSMGNLYVELGDAESLRIEAEDNLLPYLETEVDNGILEIKQRDMTILRPTRPINFYLTVRELDTIRLSGSGNIEAPELQAEQFTISVLGSGNVQVDGVEAERTAITLAGSGDITLQRVDGGTLDVDLPGSGSVSVNGGEVDEQEITIPGSGNYRARNLHSERAEARVIGSGSVTIQVSEELDASIAGSGSIRYAGRPAVSTSITGSGDVESIED